MKLFRLFLVMVFAGGLALTAGCGNDDSDLEEGIEDAGDNVQDQAEETGNDMEDAAEDATN